MSATSRRLSAVVLGVAGTALVATGCSTSTTAPATPAEPHGGTSSAAESPSSFSPPSGATELSSSDTGGVSYARYSVSGTTPQAVIADYTSQAESAGYTVSNSGGGGGGWGGWGGASAGVTAAATGSYLDVQAGGQSGGTTYFEVCVGPDESAVDQCDQNSQQDQNNQNQNDSNSGAS